MIIKREKYYNNKNKKKVKEIFLIVLIASIFFISNSRIVFAQSLWDLIGGAISGLGVSYIEALWIIHSIRTMQVFFDSVYANLPVLILTNPKVENFAPGMAFFMNLVIPFYILGILATALYMLFLSGSVEGRAKAKSNLIRLLYSLLLVGLSPLLLKFLFTFSSTIAATIMNLANRDLAIKTLEAGNDFFYEITVKVTFIYPGGEAGSFYGSVLPATYYLFYILMIGRYVFITFFGMLLPLSIFFYSFYSTKGLGKMLVQQLIMIVFIQVAWAIAISAISVSTSMLLEHTRIPANHIEWVSYVMFVASPMVILGLMDWFGFIVFVIDSTTTGPLCVGPVVMDELYAGRVILPEEVVEDVADM